MQSGATPVYEASFVGHTDIVRILLENKADPNISTNVSCCYCVSSLTTVSKCCKYHVAIING